MSFATPLFLVFLRQFTLQNQLEKAGDFHPEN